VLQRPATVKKDDARRNIWRQHDNSVAHSNNIDCVIAFLGFLPVKAILYQACPNFLSKTISRIDKDNSQLQ
jgi:hypothetical protein